MPFQMSDKAKVEEELLEVASFMSNLAKDLDYVIAHIKENERIDHENDELRKEAMALLIFIMNDPHANGAFQKLSAQERSDYKDDIPRTQALIKLSVFREKAVDKEKRIKGLLKELNQKPQTEGQGKE